MSRQVTAPHVYRAINSISAAMSRDGIPKAHMNLQDQYSYRSIDDVLGRLAPLLAKHRLCVLPRVLKRECTDRLGEFQTVLTSVHVLIAYDLISSRDGSRHTIRASGEALDSSDKATAKAVSAAYKSAMLQTFCVPVSCGEDTESKSPKSRKIVIGREPVQGWQAWSDDIVEMVFGCETTDALDVMRNRQAALLTAISRERPELYSRVGVAFTIRVQQLATPAPLIERPTNQNQMIDAAPIVGEAIDA